DPAADASQALSLFDHGDYDLVLTDYVMPGVTGLELVERVRDRDPRVGVIMLTATPLDVSVHEARLGFRLLRKPLAVFGLEQAVREVLAGR
ncbi:MAG TPA: response regulator, partial [Methylomirabilota bacterium]|nr:response regulator [Methylomirabilota bacterium]